MNQNNKDYKSFTPKEIVAELDKHIVGQKEAKIAVSIALRNRWRRRQLSDELRSEIVPKNILMVGPTGVGKTEIARRLAKLAAAPFIKVEATKFTEVGYVGRDVDSIIRDLIEIAVQMIKTNLKKEIYDKAKIKAEEIILDLLVGDNSSTETREKFKKMLDEEALSDREIEIKVKDNSSSMPTFDIPGMPGSQMGVLNISDIMGKTLGLNNKSKAKRLRIEDAYKILISEESDKMLDDEKIITQAINLVENDGIVFLDEIDKIVAKSESKTGAEVSREGVQRDLLPLIEGTAVSTKYGSIKTDHILFIASGAFHLSKPSDLLPELQGRLPIRVELKPLSHDDMVRILNEPEVSLLKQYQALMSTEKVELNFTEAGINEIAKLAIEINKEVENIGARRLHTIMEKLLEELSYNASESPDIIVNVDDDYVNERIGDLIKQNDLSKFIL